MALPPSSALAQKANYHDVAEIEAFVDALHGFGDGLMTVHSIGTTFNDREIRAVLVSENRPGGDPSAGNGDRPALLVECGMHGHEWAGPEACLHLLASLSFAYSMDLLLKTRVVRDILDYADIWIIPLVNPDGRATDDMGGGDPEVFFSALTWHPHSPSALLGWRPSGQTVACPRPGAHHAVNWGIDINRAFSRGWTLAIDDCRHNEYRGDHPFQSGEAGHLRRFVSNRMISMSLSVHANEHCVGAASGPSGIPENLRTRFNASVASELALSPFAAGACIGPGTGDFAAWMAKRSETGMQKDYDTIRGAVALRVDLPPDTAAYDDVVNPSPYRFDPLDGSNAVHPSGASFPSEVGAGFSSALFYLMRQVRSPWCTLDPTTLAPDPSCANDVGLTGSKIANCIDCEGALEEDFRLSETAQTMPAGARQIVYRVQNYDVGAPAPQDVTVTTLVASRATTTSPYVTDLNDVRTHVLGALATTVDTVPFTFIAGREYVVRVRARYAASYYDANADNDAHVYRFEVY